MRWVFVSLSMAVSVAFLADAPSAAAQGLLQKGLLYIAPVVIGTMYGVQHARAQEEKKKEEAAIAEREKSEYRIRALEESLRALRDQREKAAQEAKIKAERDAANRRMTDLLSGHTFAMQIPKTGKVYKLGPGWPTTAQYCVSYVPGVCSPCDYNGQTCDGHVGEPLIHSEDIK